MNETNELERLRSIRAEVEAESRTLKETQQNMENRLKILEEKIAIDDLESKNKTARNAVAQLESKLKMLESRLK
jgi:hypothetical protein